jgi:hypothetical protein
MFTTLIKEANEVRKWALHQKNAPVDLFGWCAICSFELFKTYKKKNLKPVFNIVESPNNGDHCFITCCNYLIDVTATQFEVKDVVNIIEIDKVSKKWFWNLKKSIKCKTVSQIKKH